METLPPVRSGWKVGGQGSPRRRDASWRVDRAAATFAHDMGPTRLPAHLPRRHRQNTLQEMARDGALSPPATGDEPVST
jgi:hypothetical protein